MIRIGLVFGSPSLFLPPALLIFPQSFLIGICIGVRELGTGTGSRFQQIQLLSGPIRREGFKLSSAAIDTAQFHTARHRAHRYVYLPPNDVLHIRRETIFIVRSPAGSMVDTLQIAGCISFVSSSRRCSCSCVVHNSLLMHRATRSSNGTSAIAED